MTKVDEEEIEIEKLLEESPVSATKELRIHWDSLESYFMDIEDPLKLGIDYQIVNCTVEADFESVKLRLKLMGRREIYCNLPAKEPADLNLVIQAFQSSGEVQKLLATGGI
jgi:hypothetical protein